VAFDDARAGFAHLHPNPVEGESAKGAPASAAAGTAGAPLVFRLTIPSAGRYVIWAQVKVAGREVFAPFWFEVAP
jgi:hypothetical protein